MKFDVVYREHGPDSCIDSQAQYCRYAYDKEHRCYYLLNAIIFTNNQFAGTFSYQLSVSMYFDQRLSDTLGKPYPEEKFKFLWNLYSNNREALHDPTMD